MKKTFLEFGIAVAVGVVLFVAVYLPLTNGCCTAIEIPLLYLFSPAIIIGSFVGGGFDRAGTVAALVGVVGEVLIVWLVIWLVRMTFRRSKGANDV